MSRRFSSLVCLLTLAAAAGAAPARWYVNDSIVSEPVVIDAINFVNNNQFSVSSELPFTTSDTLRYTNRGIMNGLPGFDFKTFPSSIGTARRALSFNNVATGLNGGVINCAGLGTLAALTFGTVSLNFGDLTGSSQMYVNCDKIFNSGTINMDQSSLLSFRGGDVNMSRGTVQMNTTFNFLIGGITTFGSAPAGLDGYWGVGVTNRDGPLFVADLSDTFVFTPAHSVTNRNGVRDPFHTLVLADNLSVYVDESAVVNSNRVRKAVFLRNTNSAFATSVYFDDPSQILVQWAWVSTNQAGTVVSNYLVLSDTFGERTNLQVAINGVAGFRPTFKPVNYTFSFQNFDYGTFFTPATPGLPLDFLQPSPITTNEYAAYEAIFSAATQFPSDKFHGDITNLEGRIEITADRTLNLRDATLLPLNTLNLKAPNQYDGNSNGVVSAPYYVLNLHTTNSQMSLSNLVPALLPVPAGTCDLWSARWTNTDTLNITNAYHVLVVDANLAPNDQPLVQSLKLVAPNLILSDRMNVTRDMLLNTERLTLTTNGPFATSPFGEIKFSAPGVVWSSAAPRLQYLTNWGGLTALNSVFFGGHRTSPFFNTTFDEAYVAFVNHGGITNQGSLVWANHFENTGTVDAGGGPIRLNSGIDVSLQNGLFLANGDIYIHARDIVVTNHPLISGSTLSLWITNSITDGGGGATNGNVWTAYDGFNLFLKPPTGDLLGTTVFNVSPPKALTLNYWAGEDRGPSVAGYVDNVAVGWLALEGTTNTSAFSFQGTGDQNAMYVDMLELEGSAASIAYDGTGYVLPALKFEDNMTIYYADATSGGVDIAEHINGANHGHLVWVPGYAGTFSTVTLAYTNTDGSVFNYTMNSALRNSTFIDSDGDGLVNAVDPTPLGSPPPQVLSKSYSPPLVGLNVAITNKPKPTALVSWNTIHNSTNHLYYTTSYNSTNWHTLTNFVYKGPAGRVTVKDPIKSAAPRFYKVRIDPPKKK